FGEQEWAVRLSAVLFGVATIPAIYWVSRFALSRCGSLCVAVLLASSYHHIFFSQNARGYTAYLFFSVLSSGLLVKGLKEDRARHWVLYVLTMFLNFASLLDSIFVFASHVLVGVFALLVVKRHGGPPLPLARRLAAVFTVTGVLVLNLYVTMAPQFYIYSKTVYRDPAAGFSPFSVKFYSVVSSFSNYLRVTTRLFVPRVATILVLIGVAISLFSLRHYYSVPKQSYSASLHYIEAQRQPGDPMIAIYLSEHGYRFYGKKFGLKEGEDWFPVRSVESLDSVVSKTRGHPSIVVTTFARALRIRHTDLLARIVEGWTLDRIFPATIGDGEISVWKERPGDRESTSNRN